MKRSSPMKRSGFARRTDGPRHIADILAEALPKPLPRPTRWLAGAPTTERAPVVTPKHDYIRSEALMRAYRALPCQHCGISDGTVCGAHSNWGMGKGGAIKADDNRCASLCMACHHEIDQGSKLSAEERFRVWATAHASTVAALVKTGSWPAGIPIPDTSGLLAVVELA